MALYKTLSRALYRHLCRRLCRHLCGFIGTFIGVLGAQSGSIVDRIYRVKDKLLNRGISEPSSAILGVKV